MRTLAEVESKTAARKRKPRVNPKVRRKVIERDGWRCQLCGRKTPERFRFWPYHAGNADVMKSGGYDNPVKPEHRMTVDHIIPISLGGTNNPSNLRAACRDCNGKRGNRIWS